MEVSLENGRYHWETIRQREYARDLDTAKDLDDFVKDYGVRLEAKLPIVKLASALCFIQSRVMMRRVRSGGDSSEFCRAS